MDCERKKGFITNKNREIKNCACESNSSPWKLGRSTHFPRNQADALHGTWKLYNIFIHNLSFFFFVALARDCPKPGDLLDLPLDLHLLWLWKETTPSRGLWVMSTKYWHLAIPISYIIGPLLCLIKHYCYLFSNSHWIIYLQEKDDNNSYFGHWIC